MTVAIVTFRYGTEFDAAAFNEIAAARRSIYEGMPGLLQKIYWVAPERGEGGAVYVWESRAAAERVQTTEWLDKAEQAFGVRPEIRYADVTDAVVNQPLRVRA